MQINITRLVRIQALDTLRREHDRIAKLIAIRTTYSVDARQLDTIAGRIRDAITLIEMSHL